MVKNKKIGFMLGAFLLSSNFAFPLMASAAEAFQASGTLSTNALFQADTDVHVETKKPTVANTPTITQNTSTEIMSDEQFLLLYQRQQKIDQLYNIITPLIGNVPYRWGAKYYDGWTYDNGFDCSGFVNYVFECLYPERQIDLNSTGIICGNTHEISKEELDYGDLGLLWNGCSYYTKDVEETMFDENENITTATTQAISYTGDFDGDGQIDSDVKLYANHVGIYMGKDENGNNLWAHCNAKDGTVVINTVDYFTYFCRVESTNLGYSITEHEEAVLRSY